MCWAGPHCLALATSNDTAVRLLQLDTDDNYMLDLQQAEPCRPSSGRDGLAQDRGGAQRADSGAGIAALVYEPGQGVLAVATGAGRVCLFKHWLSQAHAAAAEGVKQWEPLHTFMVSCCLLTEAAALHNLEPEVARLACMPEAPHTFNANMRSECRPSSADGVFL